VFENRREARRANTKLLLNLFPRSDADKTTYMVMFRNHTAGRSHNTEYDNNPFESVEEFK